MDVPSSRQNSIPPPRIPIVSSHHVRKIHIEKPFVEPVQPSASFSFRPTLAEKL